MQNMHGSVVNWSHKIVLFTYNDVDDDTEMRTTMMMMTIICNNKE